MHWDVIVVGAGAAGLWSAGTAALRGRRTLLLEKNSKPGVKILMSGGTRCNLTHDAELRAIVEAFGPAGRFLHGPLSQLGPHGVVHVMESLGVPTKVEAGGKIFPRSDRAIDVRDALVRRFLQAGGQVQTGSGVLAIQPDDSGANWSVRCQQATYTSTSLVVATGGLSYGGCGTTGDGYPWARQLGHGMVPTRPALAPLLSPEPWVHALSGLTLDDVVLTVEVPELAKALQRDPRLASRSSLLFTHFGLSGPAAMNVSRAVEDPSQQPPSKVCIDLLPDVSAPDLARRLSPGARAGSTHVSALLRELVPRRLADELMNRAGIELTCPLAELARTARQSLVTHLKSLRIPVTGTRGYDKAEVTAGGVDLRDVDSRTMQSRHAAGLYLVGELLDLDGPIGGYNFQAAFSTGHVAGLNA